MTINITATVQKDGAWWLITVPKYDIVGQAAHLKDAEPVAKEITALWLDEDEDEIKVKIEGGPQG